MKAYERREAGGYPYFKLNAWDARIGVWRPFRNRSKFATEAEAIEAVPGPGRFRVLRVDDGSSTLLEPFDA